MVRNNLKILVTGAFVALLIGLGSYFVISKNTNTVGPSANPEGAVPSNPVDTDSTLANAKIVPPVSFLLVGDSMMRVGFGPALEKTLHDCEGVSVVRVGEFSTGLNRTDFFDWKSKTEELIELHQPDVLIVMFGANDGQGIIDGEGKAHPLGTEGWSEVYGRRVNAYLTQIAPKVKKLFWIGHPIPGNEKMRSKFSAMNPVYQAETAKFPNAVYVNAWDRFAVNGEYKASIPDDDGHVKLAKQSDGVHVTDFGGKIMTDLVVKTLLPFVELEQTTPVDPPK